jgi:formylmethanofuran dehydrogenase subunit D
MCSLRLTLITGRSTKQGTGISTGKQHPEYREATNVIDLSQADMDRAGLSEGSTVGIKTEFGMVEVKCRRADIPEGMSFIAFGSVCNQLVGGETCASGMPDSKHLQVEMTPVNRSSSPFAGSAASTGNGKS